MNDVIKYQTDKGEIELSPQIVRQYLIHGNGSVTNQEMMMFLALCKYQRLNPFLREVYLIKYGSETATMVTGKETFLKRASKNQRYQGHKTGISEDGKVAWAEVYVQDYQTPIRCEVDYEEYVGRKKDGTVNRMWREKPRTMLKKVALVQALREAFPEDLGGMYSQEEINTIGTELPTEEITVKAEHSGSGSEEKPIIQRDKPESEVQVKITLPGQAPEPVKDLRHEIRWRLDEITQGNAREAGDLLAELSAFDGVSKDGKPFHFNGWRDADKITEAALKAVYGKVSGYYEQWRAKDDVPDAAETEVEDG